MELTERQIELAITSVVPENEQRSLSKYNYKISTPPAGIHTYWINGNDIYLKFILSPSIVDGILDALESFFSEHGKQIHVQRNDRPMSQKVGITLSTIDIRIID